MYERFMQLLGPDDACRDIPWMCWLTGHAAGNETRWDVEHTGCGTGELRAYGGPDAVVSVVNCQIGRGLVQRAEALTDLLLVRASVSSRCRYRPDGGDDWTFHRPAVTVSALPSGTRFEVNVEQGAPQRAVTVLMEPGALLKRHPVAAAELPAPLCALIEGELRQPQTLLSMPIDADIAALVDDLAHSRLTGALRGMQVQARATELLALVAAAWKECLDTEQWPGLRARDSEIVAAARRILMSRFAHPPTLQQLSAEIGTNKNKLNRLFQEQLGATPQVYCLRLRIERAQALIAEGRLNVGQVADAVGYQHQSSFAVAFRDVTGLSPREFARNCGVQSVQAEAGPALH